MSLYADLLCASQASNLCENPRRGSRVCVCYFIPAGLVILGHPTALVGIGVLISSVGKQRREPARCLGSLFLLGDHGRLPMLHQPSVLSGPLFGSGYKLTGLNWEGATLEEADPGGRPPNGPGPAIIGCAAPEVSDTTAPVRVMRRLVLVIPS